MSPNMEPFTSSPSGAGVSSGSRIFCCASAVWPGSSDGVTLAGYKSWRRSVAVKQRPPCLYACVCASCVCACVREREGGRGGGGPETPQLMDDRLCCTYWTYPGSLWRRGGHASLSDWNKNELVSQRAAGSSQQEANRITITIAFIAK